MSIQASGAAIDSGTIVERLLQQTSKEQLKKLVDVALANSGEVVGNSSFEPGDDLCPNFYFPFPFPPKFDQFLSEAVLLGSVRLVIQGIINPEGVLVQVGLGRMDD